MNTNRILLVLALASGMSEGAMLSWSQSPDGSFLDVNIGSLGGSQVGAFALTLDFNPSQLSVISVATSGFLGIPDVETLWQLQNTLINPTTRRLEITEISLLSSADLAALQPQTFGLIRLYVQWMSQGTAQVSLSGTISDAAGNPINTMFPAGQLSNIPEPQTFWLAGFALILLRLLVARRC